MLEKKDGESVMTDSYVCRLSTPFALAYTDTSIFKNQACLRMGVDRREE